MAPGATVSALMRGDAFAFVEDLDRAGGDASAYLLAHQGMGNRAIEVLNPNTIVDAHVHQLPLCILIFCCRQWLQRWSLEALQQIGATDAELAHRPRVHIHHDDGDGGRWLQPVRRRSDCEAGR